MEQDGNVPGENGGVPSTTSTARASPPPILLNVQTLGIPSVPHFLQLFLQNLYRMLRSLVSQVQLCRLRNFYVGLRQSQYRSLDKIRQVQNSVNSTLAVYNRRREIIDSKFESKNKLLKEIFRRSTVRNEATSVLLKAVENLYSLKKNLAILNHYSTARTYRKLKLRKHIRKANVGVIKAEKKMSKLDTEFWEMHATYKAANKEFMKADKEFNEQHGSTYEDLSRILDAAKQEFERENLIHEQQLEDLRRGLGGLQRDHRMGILRTVPLTQLWNHQQQRETVQEAGGTSENLYDWQNLIYYRVDLVMEARDVTRVYY